MSDIVKMDIFPVGEDGVRHLSAEFTAHLAEYEDMAVRYKATADSMKEMLKAIMEQYGIVKLEDDNIAVNYFPASTRETFDTKTFRAENPGIYDAYCEIKPTEAFIKVKVKPMLKTEDDNGKK